ncbi:glycoside hydrolase family 99-like domain-containing protein [Natronorubrum sp. FCH18a]|uniref:glycoside hydrolase family 99-like domain-containing protein n=1 Tax=Natronorubrum sp. FCH18a TaxID=3447018 RepID=UPI003F514C7F
MNRRHLLAALGGIGYTSISGCAENNTDGDPASSRSNQDRVPSSSVVSDPAVLDLSYELDDNKTAIESRELRVSGELTIGSDGTAKIELSDGTVIPIDEEEVDATIELDGGQRYTLSATVTNDNGTDEVTRQIGYVPSPTTKVDKDRLIGTHYYVWWGADWHWNEGYPGTPVLGEYNARDPDVIDTHIEWATAHGINWFSVSWWGRDSWSDITLRDYFPEADRSDDIEISILYEPHDMLDITDGWRVDFDDPANKEQFVKDFSYLAETYFDRENYLHINDQPAVYIYLAQGFMGDVSGTFEAVRDKTGVQPYIIGDFEVGEWEPVDHDLIDQFEAVSDYVPFYADEDDVEENYPEEVLSNSQQWMLALEDSDVNYIPAVGPAFDKSYHRDGMDQAVLTPEPEEFAEYCRETVRQFDPDVNAALITSFNEWYEGTIIEPTEEWNTRYLEIVEGNLVTHEETYENRDRYGRVTIDFESLIDEKELNPDADRFSRDLAFVCHEITLLDSESQVVESYDIGTNDDPMFTEGAYNGESYNEDTWRWFGGPTGRTTFLVSWDTLSPVRKLSVTGNAPDHSTTISATVSIDALGEREITFDKGHTEYEISFTSFDTGLQD